MDIDATQTTGLAVAAGLGFLVGLQREWIAGKPIGLRSFVLIGTLGGLVGLFTQAHGGWVLASGLLAITVAVFGQTIVAAGGGKGKSGITTELAAVAVFMIGALATSDAIKIAVVVGGAVTLLLHWKEPMHKTVQQIGEGEFEAITRFILVTLIVLPMLPNQAYGPYAVLNPWQIWLMVALIVSLNVAGYVALKFFSGRGGALMSGMLGGLISSTATTVAFSRRARSDPELAPVAGIIIIVASSLVYLRIFIEVGAVASGLLTAMLLPVGTFTLLFAFVIGVSIVRFKPVEHDRAEPENPAEFSTALGFGALYSVVIFVSAAVNEHFGETMLYPVAILSGLTDVDAITLSTANLYDAQRIDMDTAWRLIFVASLSNLVFKAGIVAMLGGAALRRRVLPALVGLAGAGFLGVAVWP